MISYRSTGDSRGIAKRIQRVTEFEFRKLREGVRGETNHAQLVIYLGLAP